MTLTPEDLRQRIPTWSLESDGQLLQYMISIAKNLEEKCTKTRDNLNNLMLQVNQTELKLSNATNQFSAVEQVKFVENRVEEDDESFYGLRRRRQQQQQQQQLVDERTGQKETNADTSLDDLIQLAVERSIEGMYNSYEKVTLQLTDSDTSDDEEEELPSSAGSRTLPEAGKELSGGKTTIMRAFPRHPFIDRPLPHVIGTKEWQNKWHVGLIDSDDESNSDRKEEYSESSASETDDDDRGMYPSQPNSKNHTPSESESSGIWGAEVGRRKRAPSIDPSITGDDGSSVYSYASSSKPRAFSSHPAVPRGPVSLGASLKPPNLFPEEPPEEVGDGRRRNDRGLFDESPEEDEESSIPLPTPRKTPSTTDSNAPFFKGTIHQSARKTVNLFDDEPPSLQESGERIHEPKKTINLFIESDNEEEANENARNNNNSTQHVEPTVVVKPSTNARHGHPTTTTTNRTMAKLVDELNNNFRKPAPEVRSSNSAVQPGKQRPTTTNLFEEQPPVDDFDQMFSGSKGSVSKQPTELPQPTTRTLMEKKPVNLFEDDAEDDDDAFDGLVVGSNEKKPEPVRSPFISPNRIPLSKQQQQQPARTSKSKSIFDDSDSDSENNGAKDSGLFANAEKNHTAKPVDATASESTVKTSLLKPVKSIFDDSSETEDDDDALFGRSSDIVKNKLDALKRNGAGSATTKPVTGPVNATEGSKSTKSDTEIMPTNKTKSIFDDDSDDDTIMPSGVAGSLFAKEPSSKHDAPKPPPIVGGTTNLFDADSTTDDDQPGGVEVFAKECEDNHSAPKPDLQPQMKDEFLLSEEKSKLAQNANDRLEVVSSVKTDTMTVSEDPLGGSVVSSSDVSKSIPKAPAAVSKPSKGPADSIRNMIMKKSIFNSDSESEEDDLIFGSSTAVPVKEESVPQELEVTKNDTNECDNETVHLKQNRETVVERSSIEATLKEASTCQPAEQNETLIPPSAYEQLLDNNDNAGSANKDEVSRPLSNTGKEIFASDVSEELPVDKNTVHAETNAVSKQPTEDDTKSLETQSAYLDDFSEQQREEDDKSTQPDGLQRSLDNPHPDPPVEKEKINDDTTPGAVSEGQEPPSNPPIAGMIANDIDYFLHTNELISGHEEPEALPRIVTPPSPPAVKSEPKSALNFSPIGLFDDVPPPDDDEGDRDDHGLKRHFHHIEPSSSLQSVDDPAGYPTESQSLNFIPNGSGGGNGRTRYLFDDEPPPDEADNSSPSFGEIPPPFRGVVPKALFEERQRSFDAPASLPPMISDTDKAPPRPKVNKLNSKLAINVAALLPGARRPPSTATVAALKNSDSSDSVFERSKLETTPGSLDHSAVPAQTSGAVESKGEKLTGLNKGRARIPTKRKPPSRQTLRAAAVPERQNADDPAESDDRIVVGSEEKLLHVEAAIADELVEKRDISKLDPLVDRLRASVRNPSIRNARPDGNEGFGAGAVAKSAPKQLDPAKSASLFDDSDDDGDEDDFFSKLPAKVPSKQPILAASGVGKTNRRSIFGSDEDDDGDGMDDIFGGKTSTIAKQLKSKPPFEAETKSILGVASVKPPLPKASVSLFGDDNSDGDDDLFGSSKTKNLAKPSETKPSVRPPQSSTTTKPASTTRTVKDPLADLLN